MSAPYEVSIQSATENQFASVVHGAHNVWGTQCK